MFTWFAENAVTLIALAALLTAVGLAVRSLVKKKKTCSCGCTGDCATCGMGCCGGAPPQAKPSEGVQKQ